jgi:hypothetical protein
LEAPCSREHLVDVRVVLVGQAPGHVANTGPGENPPKGQTTAKEGETADTKVSVDDAVVAKAPTGEEVDFKKISVDEALKVLKVCWLAMTSTTALNFLFSMNPD